MVKILNPGIERMSWERFWVSLTQDLQIEILIRLPVKSLMRFKCIQRSWNILFKSPSFVNKKRLYNSEYDKGHSLMILHKYEYSYITLLYCDYHKNRTTTTTTTPTNTLFPDKGTIFKIKSYGSCNGVFLLEAFYWDTIVTHLILWNPTTKEVHVIPDPPSCCDSKFDDSLYGFCAFNNDNNFKVVRLQLCFDENSVIYPSLAEVYNLCTKSWTRSEHPPPATPITRQSQPRYTPVVNYVYHWITTSDPFSVSNILCYDFRKNQFHQLKAPREVYRCARENIAEIKGSLAYILEYHQFYPTELEIWVMDQGKWAKKYNIGLIETCMRGLSKNGDQVFGGGGKLLRCYDHQGNLIRQFEVSMNYGCSLFLREYVQSIIPLS